MSQILKDLNKLAEKMGAPVVGRNISEQVRAISTFYEGTTHGANIAERINEVRHAYHTSGSSTLITKTVTENKTYNATDDDADGYSSVTVNVPEPTLITKSIIQNGNYSASDDSAEGYSSVSVNVPAPAATTKYLKSHGSEYIVIPAATLARGTNSVMELDFKVYEIPSSIQWIFGTCSSNANNAFCGLYSTTGTINCQYRDSNASFNTAISSSDFSKGAKMLYGKYVTLLFTKANNKEFWSTMTMSGDNPTNNYDFGLFCRIVGGTPEGNGLTMGISRVKFYNAGSCIFNATPKINPSTNKACLYDSISETYFGNNNASSQTDFEIVEEYD